MAQEKALEATLAFVECAAIAGRYMYRVYTTCIGIYTTCHVTGRYMYTTCHVAGRNPRDLACTWLSHMVQ